MLGIGQFLLVYFGSALTASLAHLSYNCFYRPRFSSIGKQKRYVGSLGASGNQTIHLVKPVTPILCLCNI